MNELKLKVNDVCRVIANINKHNFKIGEVVTIKQCFSNGKTPHYLCKTEKEYWYLQDDELKTIERIN